MRKTVGTYSAIDAITGSKPWYDGCGVFSFETGTNTEDDPEKILMRNISG